MPSLTPARPLTVTLLAALWVSLGRCDVSGSPGPGCDTGKLYLDRDLPEDALHWDCPVSTWPKSTQRLPGVDTLYDPETARQICMDKSVSYSHTIPNSGAYRPVRAESGEYLYCPPQRWLNNLHHAATVLLYHPCAPLHERLLLSVLARSCLPDYIITPHPQLNKHMPIALVSWGRTLELSTVASSDVCDWLETTTFARNKSGGVSQSRKYNLLLTWSAEQHRAHPEEHSAKMQESMRQCCEQTISSLLNGAMEANMGEENLRQIKQEGKSRRIRAAIQTSKTADVQRDNSTQADSSPGNRTLSDPPGPGEAPSQTKIQNLNQGLTPRPTTPTLRTHSLGFGTPASQKSRLALQTAAEQPSVKGTALRKPNPSAGLDDLADGVKSDSKDKHSDKDSTADGTMKNNEVVDVKERELDRKQTHSDTHSHHKGERTGFDSVSKSQSVSPQERPNPQPASDLPNRHDCDGCQEGEGCECNSGGEARAAVVTKGLPRTPRTDDAVWAAAALGFLLVLLTLSVLHTRLYRHWRTAPSLYWHNPQQDYDSVADVIRRRLRIAKRRRKRGRRQECVLLPSSSSSDEHP